MPQAIRDRLTYANVMATLAVFIALGGSSYAALRVGSKQIRDNSVRSKDVRNRGLTGSDVAKNRLGGEAIKESTLGRVPMAANSEALLGLGPSRLIVRCPGGTRAGVGVCLEEVASPPADYGAAGTACELRGRRLASWDVLRQVLSDLQVQPAAGGEWTSNVFESRSVAGRLDTVVITSSAGSSIFAPAVSPTEKTYRCMTTPADG